MKEAMVSELKARLSRYLALVRGGETVIVRDRKTPVAKLVPYARRTEKLRLEPASSPAGDLAGIPAVKLLRPVDPVRLLRKDRDER